MRVEKIDGWVDLRLGVYRMIIVEKLGSWNEESVGSMVEEVNYSVWVIRGGSEVIWYFLG